MNRCPIEAEQSRYCYFLQNGECCNGIVYGDSDVCNANFQVRSQDEWFRNMATKILVLKARMGDLGERGVLVITKLESFSAPTRRRVLGA